MTLNWGIVSAGKISHDFVTAVQTLPASDHRVAAIAARSKESAANFAKTHNIPISYGGYEQLAADKTVEVVYIGALNPQHYDVALLMLQHNKHVLCEKPFTMNAHQTGHLVTVAKEKKLFLMEAVWSRCFPAYAELRKLIKSGTIGDIVNVYVNFGFYLKEIERLKSKQLGGGTILDLGVYTLQFQQFIFDGITPLKVIASGHLNDDGVDDSVSAILTYPDGKTAVISTSSLATLPNEAIVVGTKGTVRMPEFWSPTKLITAEKTYEFPLPETSSTFNYHNSVGLAYEAEVVRQCIRNGKIESDCITHEQSIQLATLMDNLRKQVGVIFPDDLK